MAKRTETAELSSEAVAIFRLYAGGVEEVYRRAVAVERALGGVKSPGRELKPIRRQVAELRALLGDLTPGGTGRA